MHVRTEKSKFGGASEGSKVRITTHRNLHTGDTVFGKCATTAAVVKFDKCESRWSRWRKSENYET